MKKIVIPLLWGLFATIPQPLPATSYKSIIVNQSDGSEMKVTIEDDMKTTVAEGNLVITCTKGDIVLPVIDIKNWTFSTSAGSDDVWTGIESPTASGTNCILNSDRIILSNCSAMCAFNTQRLRVLYLRTAQRHICIDL